MSWKKILTILTALFVSIIVAGAVIIATYDFNSLKPLAMRLVKENTGRDLVIGGDITLKFRPSPCLAIEGVRFQNAPWGSRPDMGYVKRLEVQIDPIPLLSRKIRMVRLLLIEPDIMIERDIRGVLNTAVVPSVSEKKAPESAFDEEDVGFSLSVGRIRIEKGLVLFQDAGASRTYNLQVDELDVAEETFDDMIRVYLKGSFNDCPMEVRGGMDNILQILVSNEPCKLDLTLKLGEAILALKGSVGDVGGLKGLELVFSAKGPSVQALAREFELVSIPPIGQFDIRFKLTDPESGLFEMDDLRVTAEGVDLSGKAGLRPAGERPDLAVDLYADTLDLRPIIKAVRGTHAPAEDTNDGPAEVKKKKDKVFSSRPFMLSCLHAADIRYKIKAAKFITHALAAENLHVEGSLKDGVLTVHPFKACAGGAGSMEGEVELRAGRKGLNLNAVCNVSQADLEFVYKTMGKKSPAAGLLDLDLEMAAAGASMAGLMADLKGTVEITMAEGRLDTTSIAFLGGDLTDSILGILNPLEKKRDYTPVNCFAGRCDIDGGMAKISALVLDTPETTLLGEGYIDLRHEKLKIGMQSVPKKGLSPVKLSLGNLTSPFELGGTLADPHLELNLMKSTVTVGKALGGMAVFGPFGILAALSSTDSGNTNPCMAALEKARNQDSDLGGNAEEKGIVQKTADRVGDAVKCLGNSLKGLFGKARD